MTLARAKYVLVAVCFYLLSVLGLSTAGLLGPDEPRYASIGREMAISGDWITPRLWGEPWFEKPPLLYWMIAAGFRMGLDTELAPRLPVALTSIAFLIFYFAILRRRFGERPAFFATQILATSAGWVAFSHAAVTDLPLAAAFGASMLLALRWLESGSRGALIGSGALLGLAVLAKGLVPLALALPFFWMARRRPASLAMFVAISVAVAAPWYIAITARHGHAFIDEFFWRHHLERFATGSLQHGRPFWFYLPVLAAGVFPWTPLIVLLFRRRPFDTAERFFAAVVLFGFVFFSASTNKLPGYVLPLFPAFCALLGVALSERPRPAVLSCSAALLGLVPITAELLPRALASGLSRAEWSISVPGAVAGIGLGALVWLLARRGRTVSAVSLVGVGALAGVVYLKTVSLPTIDRQVSARSLWKRVPRDAMVCLDSINRAWEYGLNYYSGVVLPECNAVPAPIQVFQQKSGTPEVRFSTSILPSNPLL